VGVRLDTESFALVAERLRLAGVRRVEWAEDGSVAAVEIDAETEEERDTIPCPPMPPSPAESETRLIVVQCDTDPHPDLLRDDEPVSDRIARENGWIAEQLCGGAGVERR
jgi:hypothetical protein